MYKKKVLNIYTYRVKVLNIYINNIYSILSICLYTGLGII